MSKPAHPHRNTAVSNVVTQVTPGPAVLYGAVVGNVAAVQNWLHFFDNATAVASSTTRVASYPIPAGSTPTRGVFQIDFATPLLFDKGLAYAVTTTPTGQAAPATALEVNLAYGRWGGTPT